MGIPGHFCYSQILDGFLTWILNGFLATLILVLILILEHFGFRNGFDCGGTRTVFRFKHFSTPLLKLYFLEC